MRAHEQWCASRSPLEPGQSPLACDCGAERENAQQLSPFNPVLGKSHRREKAQWLGQLPEQFCLKCEGSVIKRVVIVPLKQPAQERHFAACLNPECAHIREIEHTP